MAAGAWPTLFIPHGGGPCFFMEPPAGWAADTWDAMAAFLRGVDARLGRRPRAVLVVSGHWQAARPTLNTAARPSLLFDYSGFPASTYRLTWPVDGAPEVAIEVRALLEGAGFATAADDRRGLDHGVFVPFKLVYPEADVPVLQLSLQQALDAADHLAMGRALAPLREQGVLIVGSGMSYHNLQRFGSGHPDPAGETFDAWLTAAAEDPGGREATLAGWRDAPGAREAHPEAEHLLPLMVAAGAASGEGGTRIYADHVCGKPISAFQFG